MLTQDRIRLRVLDGHGCRKVPRESGIHRDPGIVIGTLPVNLRTGEHQKKENLHQPTHNRFTSSNPSSISIARLSTSSFTFIKTFVTPRNFPVRPGPRRDVCPSCSDSSVLRRSLSGKGREELLSLTPVKWSFYWIRQTATELPWQLATRPDCLLGNVANAQWLEFVS